MATLASNSMVLDQIGESQEEEIRGCRLIGRWRRGRRGWQGGGSMVQAFRCRRMICEDCRIRATSLGPRTLPYKLLCQCLWLNETADSELPAGSETFSSRVGNDMDIRSMPMVNPLDLLYFFDRQEWRTRLSDSVWHKVSASAPWPLPTAGSSFCRPEGYTHLALQLQLRPGFQHRFRGYTLDGTHLP